MRRTFEKSLCKCPRCVAKRRIRFLTLSGVCLVTAAGCYILVAHTKPVAPPSLNMPEASTEEATSNPSATPQGDPVSLASAQPATSWKQQDTDTTQGNLAEDGFSTGSTEPTRNLTPPDGSRNRIALHSPDPIGEAPMPHTNGWQTVPLAGASKSTSEVYVQGTSQSDVAKVAATPAESSPGTTFGEPTVHPTAETSLRKDGEAVFLDHSPDPYELLPSWLRKMEQKSNETSLMGNKLVLQIRGDPESIAAARSTTLVADPKSDMPKSVAPGVNTNREPVVAQIEPSDSTPGMASSKNFDSAATAAISPSPANAVTATGEETNLASRNKANEAVASEIAPGPTFGEATVHPVAETILRKDGEAAVFMAPSSDPYELFPRWLKEMQQKSDENSLGGNELVLQNQRNSGGGSKETNLASRSKPDEALVSGNPESAQAVPSELKERGPKPAQTSARLLASPESKTVKQDPVGEWQKPRGYITVESEPEAPRNPGTEDHPPKSQQHSLRIKDYSLQVQDRPLTGRDYPVKALDHPLKVPDHPSDPDEKSGDLRRFASAFLQTDQTGTVADQHRFYADSVHFYREGDLSWAGVAAATRRYHQERQNKRYGTGGTAAVTGPVNGGFYVVEQPVTWSRAEGSRLTRGRSVLRLRVVPTNRGGWQITSIEEIGK
jgi:hypothetical protein